LFPSNTWDKLEVLQNKKKGIVYASPNWCLNKIVFKLEGLFWAQNIEPGGLIHNL
jgi:hypothetical protein